MKSIIIAGLAATIVMAVSCKKNSTTSYSPDCSGTTKTFSGDAKPLIQSYCASAGCHNVGSHEGCGALTTYTEVYASRSSVRASIVSGSMPRGTTLTDAQKNSIVCWIDSGAPNN